MAVTLITGQPGHGKSLYAIWRGLQFVKEGREVYAAGFKELKYEEAGFKPLPYDFREFDPEDKDDQGRIMPKWQLLPHGAVILLDECYDYMPTRANGAKVPPHIDALARHRHHGYDILLVCQKHDQIDHFVKGLLDPHIHVRRKFGFNVALLKTWDRYESNCAKGTDYLTAPTWRYPKEVFKLYTSATMHTVKKKLPWYFYAPFVLVPAIGGAVWYAVHSFKSMGGNSAAVAGDEVKAVRSGDAVQASGKDEDDTLRRTNYMAWVKPRVPGQPWTAPAYDQLPVQGVPDLFCIAVDDGRCTCHTEQGTKYEVDANVCRVIARDGIYNPFRKPLERAMGRPGRESREQSRDAPGVASVAAQADGSGYWPKATIPQAYSPPEHQIAQGGNAL
jgi:zona occludens toxin